MGNKRIYLGRESSMYAKIVGGAIVTVTTLFLALMMVGFTITGSDDVCQGTPEDPCISYGKICNLGPDNYDIYNPNNIKLDFSPTIKDYWIFFKDGRVKKEFLFEKGINASTEGWRYENFTDATKPRSDRIYVHRFARYSCQDYMLVGLKEDPDDFIKWGVGVSDEYLDPFWYGLNETPTISVSTSMNVELGHSLNISTNLTGAATVCVDIDHPDYGVNYTCGTPTANFIFNISYFRKTEFNDSTTEKNYTFEEGMIYELSDGDPTAFETGYEEPYAHDGNAFTYAWVDQGVGLGYYYVNYSIPPNVNQTDATWNIKDYNSTHDITIPEQCFDPYGDGKIVLQVYLRDWFMGAQDGFYYYCYNTTGEWIDLDYKHTVGKATLKLYEEDITWSEDPVFDFYSELFGLEVNALDRVDNISVNLTGVDATNIRLYINGTLSNTIPLLVDGVQTLQNISGLTGGTITANYYPFKCTSTDWYAFKPGSANCDGDESTQSFASENENTTMIFNKTTGATRTDLMVVGAGAPMNYYCMTAGGTEESLGSGSAWQTAAIQIPDSCNNASVNNITIRAHANSGDGAFEHYLRLTSDGSNSTFLLDGITTSTATLRLPQLATVSTAIFNVTGSISEPFVEITTATDDNYGAVISSANELSQSFIPESENLTGVWLYLTDNGANQAAFTIEIGTTRGGSEISSDAQTFRDAGSGSWIYWDLTDSVLTPGTKYYISLSSAGTSSSWDIDNTNPYPDGEAWAGASNYTAWDFLVKTVMVDLTTDPKITIGELDSDYEWNATGNYTGNTQSLDLAENITEYLTDCSPESDGYCLVPFYLLSGTPGNLRVHDVNISYSYDPNPVILDSTILQSYLSNFTSGFIDIPISLVLGSAGNVTVNDVRIDYAGGNDTINIFTYEQGDQSNNETLSLITYASQFLRLLPYSWTDLLFFLPKTNSAKNVSAYGQTTTKPVFNITTQNYGGKNLNLSMKVNESFDCLNLTWSLTSTKPGSGNLINTTWQKIAGNLELNNNTNVWIWADLNECNISEQKILRPTLDIESYCIDCVGSY